MTETSHYPEHERMAKAKAELAIDEIAAYLEECRELGLPFEIESETKVIYRLAPEHAAKIAKFFAWLEEQLHVEHDEDFDEDLVTLFGQHFDRTRPLSPSAKLFAEYSGIDLMKISAEKDKMVEGLRAASNT